MEGAKIGPQDFRAAQRRVEIRPHHRLPAAPLANLPVAPEDRVVALQQHDAVGHAFEDLLVLQQLADIEDFVEEVGGHEDAGEFFPASTAPAPRTGFWTITVSWESAMPFSTGPTSSRGSEISRIFGLSIKVVILLR